MWYLLQRKQYVTIIHINLTVMFREALIIRDHLRQGNITSYRQNAESGCLQQVISGFGTVLL